MTSDRVSRIRHAWLSPSWILAFGFVLCASCASSPKVTGSSAGAPLMATVSASDTSSPGPEQEATLAPAAGNPFVGATLFINPEYKAEVESTAATLGASPLAAQARKVASFPTAIWLDTLVEVKRTRKWLDDAKAQQKAAGQPVVSVFVIYDLPNRDCAAKSSAGELTLEHGGEAAYRSKVIDPLAAELKARPDQRVVLILEPDSMPNVATNMNIPKCAASAVAYKHLLSYAVNSLAMPNVSLYLDAAHAGWLGWDGNRAAIAKLYKEVLADAGGDQKIRGFFTNVSNYNVLKGNASHKLEPSNPCPDELTYIRELSESMMWAGIKHKGYIIDTSRNGRDGLRTKWGNWCNVKGAGLGERPRAAPSPLLDAYLWVKPPGESDGISDTSAARFDAVCASPDAAPSAPEAGKWFSSYFVELVKNADPPL